MSPNRHRILLFTVYVFFFTVLSRAFYWQVIKSPSLKEKALNQTYKLAKTSPRRGLIYTNDNYPLVLNQTRYLLSVYKPTLTSESSQVFESINQLIPDFKKDNQELIDQFNKPDIKWITFPTLLDLSQKEQLTSIDGLSFEQKEVRFYPEESLASQIIGTIAKNEQGNEIGYGGLEGFYQKQLKGRPGFSWESKDAIGKTIFTKKAWNSQALDGRNLHTTINRSVQFLIEQKLQQAITRFSADSGAISIIDPHTGALIAMSSYTATASATVAPKSKNPNISDLFEPGSIFKPLVVAMGLQNKSVPRDYVCTCDRPRTYGQFTINNWDESIYPGSTLDDIIKNSDNIGMTAVIEKIGLKSFLDYFQQLGLQSRSGIDLQGEAKPLTKKYWSDIDLATASFGQGFSLTQIQMLRAFNTLANNGLLIRPHVVNYFFEEGKKIPQKTETPIRIFDQQVTDHLKDILRYAVDNSPVANLKPSKSASICAKSGTAQIAVGGNYTDSSTIASYIGFAPCDDPKYSMIVTINNPRSSPWGSSTAAPVWFELAQQLDILL